MGDIMLVNGDIVADQVNDMMVTDDDGDIIQTASNNIITYLGENQFHTDIGNDIYNHRLKFTESSIGIIESKCEDAIYQDERIDDVVDVTVHMIHDQYGTVEIEFTVETDDGRTLSNKITTNIYRW